MLPCSKFAAMERNVVVGIGETLWDMLPDGKKMGGAPANFAYHALQFGCDAYIASAVGNDRLGHELTSALAATGLNMEVAHVDYPTGTVNVEIDNKGIPSYDIRENVAWDNIPFTPSLEQLARRTAAVCFGTLAQRSAVSRRTIHEFLSAMPVNSGALKIFDINLRQNYYSKETIEESLSACNILKINDEELSVFNRLFGGGCPGLKENCDRIISHYGLEAMILTCGKYGSYVAASDGFFNFEPTPEVKVADTVGAGDSFTGSFCSALLAGKSYGEAHKIAVEVSAYVCTCNGAMPRLP